MDDVAQSLASESGVEPDLAQKGLGAALAFLKDKMGGDFGQVESSVPGSTPAMEAYRSASPAEGGIMGAVAGAVGKMLGGGGGDLLGMLGKLGISPAQLVKFLPALLLMFQKVLTPELFHKVRELLPAPPASPGA